MSEAAAERSDIRIDVLHVPFTYFPDPCGGTEVYVRSLAAGLADRGFTCAIAAPGANSASYVHEGLEVHRFAIDARQRIELAYGLPDEFAAEGFQRVLAKTRPRIVHLHARTSAVSARLIELSRAAGAKVVLTYHTPTVSCARGTMMRDGVVACDGLIETQRCTACAIAAMGVPRLAAKAASMMPRWVADIASDFSVAGGLAPRLRIPSLIASMAERMTSFMSAADHVVAVCAWVRDVLLRNGVPPEKITLSRQGIAIPAQRPAVIVRDVGNPDSIRIGYFGRIDHAKGADLLARALALVPSANIRVDIYAVRQAGSSEDAERLEAAARADARVRVFDAVDAQQVIATMAAYDVVAVPSRCLETGPLVALEAFAAGVPVLGARLGGIAELVRDGVDGVLVEPDSPSAWGIALSRLAADRGAIQKLKAGIRQPRVIGECVNDMAELYVRLVGAQSGATFERAMSS